MNAWTPPYITDTEQAKQFFETENNFDLYCAGAEAGAGVHLHWLWNSKFISLDLFWRARKKMNENLYLPWIKESFAAGYNAETIKPLLVDYLQKDNHDAATSAQEVDRLLNLAQPKSEPTPEPTPEPPASTAPPAGVHPPTLQTSVNRATESIPVPQSQPESTPIPSATAVSAADALVNAAMPTSATTAVTFPPPSVPLINNGPGAVWISEPISEEELARELFGPDAVLPAKQEEPAKQSEPEVSQAVSEPANIAGPDTQSSMSETSREGLKIQPDSTPFKQRVMLAVARGIPITVVRPRAKNAFLPEWQNSATTNLNQIDQWALQYPEGNYACVAKAQPGGFWFLEFDSPDAWDRILKETGKQFPTTFCVRSRKDRGHFYFKQTPASIAMGNIAQTFVNGQDWSARVNNEYVVGPGSIHPNTGEPYQITSDVPIIEAPDWLIEWCISQKISQKPEAEQDIQRDAQGLVPHGSIHGWMLTQAGRLRAMGLSMETIDAALMELVHKNCAPPIDDEKVHQMARSICNFPEGKPSDLPLTQQQQPTERLMNGEIVLEVPDKKLSHEITDDFSETSIPPFDRSVIKGIYKEIVEILTKGTTLEPQFIYSIAKTVVGAKMAGKVKFEDLDVEPLIYLILSGATGAGKGEAWRRVFKMLTTKLPETMLLSGSLSCYAGIKIVNSADSGAGLKDAFFENPPDQPIVCYVDEVASLGHKANEKKNPEIIDTMGELANSTSFSRVKAKRSNRQPSAKTKDDAYLAVVICGQNAEVFTGAFTGRTKVGWYDRLTPEFGMPQEAGELPPISDEDAIQLLRLVNGLPYSGTMAKSPEAKALLDQFWASQPSEIRTVARLKQELQIDAYLIAFGRGLKRVELSDMEDAIKNFNRRLAIRRVMFKGEAPNRVGFYFSLIKELTEWMRKKLTEGFAPAEVARSWRDFEKKTNARRNNEEDIFARAMDYHVKHHLDKVPIKAKNGRIYEWYLPKPEEE